MDVDPPGIVFLDLSKTTKLKHLKFLYKDVKSIVQWITLSLQTVKTKKLQSITISLEDRIPYSVVEPYLEWNHLDRLLVQFWTSHSIRPQVMYIARRKRGKYVRDNVRRLLPELARRGLLDLVKTPS